MFVNILGYNRAVPHALLFSSTHNWYSFVCLWHFIATSRIISKWWEMVLEASKVMLLLLAAIIYAYASCYWYLISFVSHKNRIWILNVPFLILINMKNLDWPFQNVFTSCLILNKIFIKYTFTFNTHFSKLVKSWFLPIKHIKVIPIVAQLRLIPLYRYCSWSLRIVKITIALSNNNNLWSIKEHIINTGENGRGKAEQGL